MCKAFEIFEDFCSDDSKKYTLAENEKEILIYVFSPEEINIVKELNFANSIGKKIRTK